MKSSIQGSWFVLWMSVVCWAVAIPSPLLAQQPTFRKSLKGHEGIIGFIAFSPDGKTLVSKGGEMGEKGAILQLWDVATGEVKATFEQDKIQAVNVTFSADGKVFASATGPRTITFWDAVNAKQKATVKLNSTEAVLTSTIAFSPDLKVLASVWDKDKTIKLWDMSSGNEKATLKGHDRLIPSVAFSPDGKTLASVSWDKTIKLWDVASGTEKATLKGHEGYVLSVAFSPDGKTLASGGGTKTSGELRLWNVSEAKEKITLKGHISYVPSVAFSPKGNLLASAGYKEKTVRIWEVSSGRNIVTIERKPSLINFVTFSPDGKILALGDWKGTINLWDVPVSATVDR